MKILFFSPHAYFSVHSLPEALVAENIALQGHEIVMVNCDGLYKRHCLCMPHIPFDDFSAKNKVCNQCKKNRDGIKKDFNFKYVNLEKFITQEDEIYSEKFAASLRPDSFLDFELDGLPVGKYALYEFWLNHKLSSPTISPPIWDEYLAIFKNTVITYYGMQKLINYESPNRLTTYNSLYSVNRITCAVADKLNIPHFTLHAGSHHQKRIQQMTIYKGIESQTLISRLAVVDKYRNTPCTLGQIDTVSLHISELFKATSPWVYSIKNNKLKSSDIRKALTISSGQKVLLAVMRSNDERLAAKIAGIGNIVPSPMFKDQYVWLDWLVKFATENPQYKIIFRVHPREFPNKREQVTSENAIYFMSFIEKLIIPENFYINLPVDNLSLHDLLKITDVLLNNSSSAGLEASLYGIPVLGIGENLTSFDPALQKESLSCEEYIVNINNAAKEDWSLSRVIKAFRWLNYLFSEVAIDISDGYKPKTHSKNNFYKLLQRILEKCIRNFGYIKKFSEVDSRSKPLAEMARLSYAIINDRDSHIGEFPLSFKNGDMNKEKTEVIRLYRFFLDSICDPEDIEFKLRFEGCIINNY